jgi:hemerythrin-like domain-containing protein
MNLDLSAAQRTEPNTHEMVVIHRIFRREFPLLAGVVRRTSTGDARRAAPIAGHIEFCLDGLHHHHSAEDEYLWPRLLERARPHADLVRRMEAQHQAVAARSEQVRRLAGRWRQAPAAQVGAQLATSLSLLADALVDHLDEEEANVLPLVREHITAAEWEELGRKAFDKIPRSARGVALGQVLEEATPQDRALFFGKLPVLPRLMWLLAGKRSYARYIRRVRGASGTRKA